MLFLGARLRGDNGHDRKLSPAERAADLQRWAASHERGPGLPDSAVGREIAIYINDGRLPCRHKPFVATGRPGFSATSGCH